MPQIKILPIDVRNKIAAGEVVERPASIVKELIENSIDAQSTEIQIDILYGGKRLIRVSDDGCGMDKEDALLCFERHATSKLSGEEDLFNIKTMGFRGEALSSIASVSKVKLVTGLKGFSSGVLIEIHGSEVKEIKESPFVGTSVEVKDLFFNTPARKKFLKSNTTEFFHILDTVTKEALAHWKIHFRLTSDNKRETINLPSSSGSKERIMQVYGNDFSDGLIEAHAEGKGIKIKSYMTRGENFRNVKSHQFIFVNKRPVKDQAISHAVYQAYEGFLPHGKHPVFFLFLDIDSKQVDINVHPTKREVRFENKEAVYSFVMNTLREALKRERLSYTKKFTEIPLHDHIRHSEDTYDIVSLPHDSHVSEPLEFSYQAYLPSLYLGDTFIAISGKGGLTLIDHHAAHERILFEKLLKGIDLNSHQLLFPKRIKLSYKEYQIILENIPLLRDFGIDVEDFGHDTVIVRSLPTVLEETDMRGILSDIASCIIGGIPPDKSAKEILAAKIACHSSVRGKEILAKEEIMQLIADLEKTEYPEQCPHGRPTRVLFSIDNLRKMFKRK